MGVAVGGVLGWRPIGRLAIPREFAALERTTEESEY